jgi:hypothetical protein
MDVDTETHGSKLGAGPEQHTLDLGWHGHPDGIREVNCGGAGLDELAASRSTRSGSTGPS